MVKSVPSLALNCVQTYVVAFGGKSDHTHIYILTWVILNGSTLELGDTKNDVLRLLHRRTSQYIVIYYYPMYRP